MIEFVEQNGNKAQIRIVGVGRCWWERREYYDLLRSGGGRFYRCKH
jgi:hypothetical protein